MTEKYIESGSEQQGVEIQLYGLLLVNWFRGLENMLRDARVRDICWKICTEHCMRFYLGNIYRDFPRIITDKFVTHWYEGFKNYVKRFLLESYRELCNVQNCYICRLYGPWSSMYWFGESTHDNHLTNNILLINILNLFLETWVATFSCFFFVCDVLLILLFCKVINFDSLF